MPSLGDLIWATFGKGRLADEGRLIGKGSNIISSDPTFIQVSARLAPEPRYESAATPAGDLVARISVPYPDALVRADVPIFGVAHGAQFKEYRIEVGMGADPVEWSEIVRSSKPQLKDATPADLDNSADITIEGNLATWDTGLRSYVYLPTHPRDHPVDLKGTYTVRLTVSGKDGATAEDRVTVAVANVIRNAWGGTAVSSDRLVTLSVPEHALTSHFRLISFEAAEDGAPVVPDDRQLVGSIYEAREAGEAFTRAAELEMTPCYRPDCAAAQGTPSTVPPQTADRGSSRGNNLGV